MVVWDDNEVISRCLPQNAGWGSAVCLHNNDLPKLGYFILKVSPLHGWDLRFYALVIQARPTIWSERLVKGLYQSKTPPALGSQRTTLRS